LLTRFGLSYIGDALRLSGLFLMFAAGAALCQDTPGAHLGRGYDALRQERYVEAADEFRAALKLDPKLAMRARFPLGVALFQMKEPAEARREFEAVRREVGDHPNVAYYLGRLDLQDQNFAGAVRNFRKAVEKPPFPDTAYYLGLACFKLGDLASAEKWLKAAVELNPNDSLAQYQLGLVYRKEGREEEAAKALASTAEIRRKDAGDSQIKMECAKKLEQGPREEARAVCQKLYDPADAEKLTSLGTLYGQHGDLEAALDPLRRAAELEPQSPQMQYNLAFTYYRMQRFEDARAPLAKALERWPDLFPLKSLYGAVMVKLGDDLAAYQALRGAHEINPQDPRTVELLYQTTLALARKNQAAKQFSEALRYFDEAANLRPEDPEPHRGLADVYTLLGRTAEAAAEQKKARR
jgi:Flp pilus assembly protein TadD